MRGALVLGVCVVLAGILNRMAGRAESKEQAAAAEKPLGKESGFEMIRKDRYLTHIALLIVLLNAMRW